MRSKAIYGKVMAVGAIAWALAATAGPVKAQDGYAPEHVVAGGLITVTGQVDASAAAPGATVMLTLTADIQEGWHVYQEADTQEAAAGGLPTLLCASDGQGNYAGRATTDAPLHEAEPLFAGAPVMTYYEGQVTWTMPYQIPEGATAPHQVTGSFSMQACDAQTCLPPMSISFCVALPVGAGTSEPVALNFATESGQYATGAAACTARAESGWE